MRNEERAAMRAGKTEEANILELPENEEKNFTFKSFFAGGAKVWKKFGVRNFVIVFSVLLIGVAVYVNWSLFGNADDIETPNDNPTGAQTSTGGENGDSAPTDGEKNDGVNFFAASQIERQRARDEAIEVLQSVVDDATALDVAKEQALADIAAIAQPSKPKPISNLSSRQRDLRNVSRSSTAIKPISSSRARDLNPTSFPKFLRSCTYKPISSPPM